MLKARYARDIFRLSAPNSVQQASGTIITTVKQGLLGGLGVEALQASPAQASCLAC